MHSSILAELAVNILCELSSDQVLTLLEIFHQDVLSGLNFESYNCSVLYSVDVSEVPTLTCAALFGFCPGCCFVVADDALDALNLAPLIILCFRGTLAQVAEVKVRLVLARRPVLEMLQYSLLCALKRCARGPDVPATGLRCMETVLEIAM